MNWLKGDYFQIGELQYQFVGQACGMMVAQLIGDINEVEIDRSQMKTATRLVEYWVHGVYWDNDQIWIDSLILPEGRTAAEVMTKALECVWSGNEILTEDQTGTWDDNPLIRFISALYVGRGSQIKIL